MLFFYFISFFIVNCVMAMEERTFQITTNEFFEKHAQTLKTRAGKTIFCNVIDLISATLKNTDQMIEILKKTSVKLDNPNEDYIFTPIIDFCSDLLHPAFEPLSNEKKKEINYITHQNIQSILPCFQSSPYQCKLNIPTSDPKAFYNILSLENMFESMNVEVFHHAMDTNLISSFLENASVAVGNNFILIASLIPITQIPADLFPYECNCKEAHYNHLDTICKQSLCMLKTLNIPTKKTCYNQDTLKMIADLLHLLPFYESLCLFRLQKLAPFINLFSQFYFNHDEAKNCITTHTDIKTLIDRTLLNTIQYHYKTFYSLLNIQEKRRSPLIFGPLNKFDKLTLAHPTAIFADFISQTDCHEEIISSANVIRQKAYEELLQESSATKTRKKTFNNNKKKNEQKSLPKKELIQKNPQNKKYAIASSNDNTNLTVQSSKQSEPNLKKELKTKLKNCTLTYNKDYLNKCLAADDMYHDFPFILDELVMLYGIAKKDLQDKNAMMYYWPIAYTTNANNTEYAVYKVVSDKNNKSIFHRGPITLTNINKLRELRTNPVYFEKILDGALPTELLFAEKEFQNAPVYLAEEYYETIDSDNQVIIKNPFKGPFGSKITEINERYVVIKSLDNTKTVYFPLIM